MPGKGLAEHIRKQSRDGYELAEWCFRVLRGQEKGATGQDKRFAVEWLSNRGFGKAPEVQLIGELAEGDNPLAEVPTDALRRLLAIEPGAGKPENAASAPATPGEDAPEGPQPGAGATIVALPVAPPPDAKCASCGLRRAHDWECPNRPKSG